MSQENAESFERGVVAWNRDDFDTWIDPFSPWPRTARAAKRGPLVARRSLSGLGSNFTGPTYVSPRASRHMRPTVSSPPGTANSPIWTKPSRS